MSYEMMCDEDAGSKRRRARTGPKASVACVRCRRMKIKCRPQAALAAQVSEDAVTVLHTSTACASCHKGGHTCEYILTNYQVKNSEPTRRDKRRRRPNTIVKPTVASEALPPPVNAPPTATVYKVAAKEERRDAADLPPRVQRPQRSLIPTHVTAAAHVTHAQAAAPAVRPAAGPVDDNTAVRAYFRRRNCLVMAVGQDAFADPLMVQVATAPVSPFLPSVPGDLAAAHLVYYAVTCFGYRLLGLHDKSAASLSSAMMWVTHCKAGFTVRALEGLLVLMEFTGSHVADTITAVGLYQAAVAVMGRIGAPVPVNLVMALQYQGRLLCQSDERSLASSVVDLTHLVNTSALTPEAAGLVLRHARAALSIAQHHEVFHRKLGIAVMQLTAELAVHNHGVSTATLAQCGRFLHLVSSPDAPYSPLFAGLAARLMALVVDVFEYEDQATDLGHYLRWCCAVNPQLRGVLFKHPGLPAFAPCETTLPKPVHLAGLAPLSLLKAAPAPPVAAASAPAPAPASASASTSAPVPAALMPAKPQTHRAPASPPQISSSAGSLPTISGDDRSAGSGGSAGSAAPGDAVRLPDFPLVQHPTGVPDGVVDELEPEWLVSWFDEDLLAV